MTYRYCSTLPWGSWGFHPLGGTFGSPAPPGHAAWVPVPGTSTTRISSWCWETQSNPVRALPPFELSSLLACRTSRSPPLAGGAPTFTCLELAQLGARRGKDTPSSPHPCFAARTGQDCRAGVGSASWDGISSDNRESKPISRDVPLTRPGLGWKICLPGRPNLNLALLQTLERTAAPWLLGSQFSPPRPAMVHQATKGPPSVRHSWTHPVSSTLSPHMVLVQSAPFYSHNPTFPLRLQPPPPKVAETVSKVPPELVLTCPDADWTSESSS